MKFTVFIVACMAIVAVQSASVQNDLTVADKSAMEKQKFFFQILFHVDQDLLMEEWIKMGEKLITEKSYYVQYSEWMMKFYEAYKSGGLLPRGEFFSIMQKYHIIQTKGLFEFFYYAKDWDTFIRNVIWARLNINEGIFVYALNMVAIHRADMQGIILPQIYEIFPQMFLNSKYIMAAQKFDWDVFNRQIMLEKEMKTIYDNKHATEMFGNRFYLKEWSIWQWWKLMGLDDGWHMEEKSVLRDNNHIQSSDPMWIDINNKLKLIWTPVDYTRDVEIFNEDSKLSYFTEDVALNAYWYYLNIDYSKMLPENEFHLANDRSGELWIYNIQQLLARYRMERYSNGLGEIQTLDYYGVVNSGYDPQLIAYNGNGYTFRKNYWQVESYYNVEILNKITSIERRIDDIIDSGKYVMKNGTVVDLTDPKSIELIGDMMQGNIDVLDDSFFGHWWLLVVTFLSGEHYHSFNVAPNVLMNYETILRDPLAYSLFKIILNRFYLFKDQLKPYTHEELFFEDVLVTDVEVSKLMTFFDLVDIDITTLLTDKMVFHDGKLVYDMALLARQLRLNHEPFNYDLHLVSKKAQKVVVRSFLGPEFNEFGQKLSLMDHRENFMELDEFIYQLEAGENVIHRSSDDFDWTASDPLTYSELYNYLMESYEGKYEFYQNISQAHSLFPNRLVLPHGWVKGMPMVMFFMVSPYTAEYQQYATYDPFYLSGIGSGVRYIDNMPFGYPLDRKIDSLNTFLVPNMYVKNVKIYHLEKYGKYFPTKYEHYGSFDYEF